MDKQFMNEALDYRIQELQTKYRNTFEKATDNYNSVTVIRSRTKQSIGICKLLKVLTEFMPDDTDIEDKDACKAFDKLVEPRRINNAY